MYIMLYYQIIIAFYNDATSGSCSDVYINIRTYRCCYPPVPAAVFVYIGTLHYLYCNVYYYITFLYTERVDDQVDGEGTIITTSM